MKSRKVPHTQDAGNKISSQVSIWQRIGPVWFSSPWLPVDTLAVKQHGLLSMLSLAQSERLTHESLIEAYALEHRGSYRRLLFQVVRRLQSGATLIDALEQTPDVLSESMLLGLRFGNQSGTLSQSYQQLLASENPSNDESLRAMRSTRFYWYFLVAIIVLFNIFLCVFIAPTTMKMSSEMEVPLPASFVHLKSTLDWFIGHAFWLVGIMLIALVLLGSQRAKNSVRSRLQLLTRSGRLSGCSAELLRILSVAIVAGRPLAASLSTLARYHFDRRIRQRLLFARNEVEHGVDAWKSLADVGLISDKEAAAIASAPNPTAQAWTMQRLSECKADSQQQHAFFVRKVTQVIVTLVLGGIVLWTCIAFFSPLTQMVEFLSK
jgi:general secretion pathway protein F